MGGWMMVVMVVMVVMVAAAAMAPVAAAAMAVSMAPVVAAAAAAASLHPLNMVPQHVACLRLLGFDHGRPVAFCNLHLGRLLLGRELRIHGASPL